MHVLPGKCLVVQVSSTNMSVFIAMKSVLVAHTVPLLGRPFACS